MPSIKPIGTTLTVDDHGFLISQSSVDKIQAKWQPPLQEIQDYLLAHFGSDIASLLLRGSVARGLAIDGLSDIDLFVVTHRSIAFPADQRSQLAQTIRAKYPFVEDLELSLTDLQRLISPDSDLTWKRSIIKTQTALLYGQDLAAQLPPVKPVPQIFAHLFSLRRDIDRVLDNLDSWPKARTERACTWIMKRLLRSGYELVMERQQAYTRDLYPCYQGFIKHYPYQEPAMRQTLSWAINPISDSDQLTNHLKAFGQWLIQQQQITYPQPSSKA